LCMSLLCFTVNIQFILIVCPLQFHQYNSGCSSAKNEYNSLIRRSHLRSNYI
jgi:hypothetical protein